MIQLLIYAIFWKNFRYRQWIFRFFSFEFLGLRVVFSKYPKLINVEERFMDIYRGFFLFSDVFYLSVIVYFYSFYLIKKIVVIVQFYSFSLQCHFLENVVLIFCQKSILCIFFSHVYYKNYDNKIIIRNVL